MACQRVPVRSTLASMWILLASYTWDPVWEGRQLTPPRVRPPTPNGLINVRDFRRHAQLRKPWNKAFASAPMKDYEDIMIQRAAQLIGHLHRIVQRSPSRQGHIDLAKWISFFSCVLRT